MYLNVPADPRDVFRVDLSARGTHWSGGDPAAGGPGGPRQRADRGGDGLPRGGRDVWQVDPDPDQGVGPAGPRRRVTASAPGHTGVGTWSAVALLGHDGPGTGFAGRSVRSEEHTSELQSRPHLV